jgi:16S rRNA (guanine966-N2)-methyltransferase
MRVIAGQYRSRLLKSMKGLALRPTSDYLRETLFNVLGPGVAGAHFLDLFAGTGAVGIEALSRGALSATFVESQSSAVKLIRANLNSLDITSGATVIHGDALHALGGLAARRLVEQFDYVFSDPPYAAAKDYDRVLSFLGDSPLKKTVVVVLEHRRTFSLAPSFGVLGHTRKIIHGDAALSFYRVS